MKKIILVLCTSFAAWGSLHAQTFAEWFEQKKTQIQYLINQIAAYGVYAKDLEKGYRVAEKGWQTINEIKNGELNLHTAFFNSLLLVNPSVSGYSRVPGIISYVVSIQNDFRKILSMPNLYPDDISYLNNVSGKMTSDCLDAINELTNLTSDNVFQLTDDQRIRRIDSIYTKMKDEYAFVQSLAGSVQAMLASRVSDQNNIQISKYLFGIK
ncbi:MAG: hypothetical protein C5B59_10000 [Bacteroidetes bacterium]|nr:MAG: hypothetical protein C5B59_10000 [Bacteroidota bacterium]